MCVCERDRDRDDGRSIQSDAPNGARYVREILYPPPDLIWKPWKEKIKPKRKIKGNRGDRWSKKKDSIRGLCNEITNNMDYHFHS